MKEKKKVRKISKKGVREIYFSTLGTIRNKGIISIVLINSALFFMTYTSYIPPSSHNLIGYISLLAMILFIPFLMVYVTLVYSGQDTKFISIYLKTLLYEIILLAIFSALSLSLILSFKLDGLILSIIAYFFVFAAFMYVPIICTTKGKLFSSFLESIKILLSKPTKSLVIPALLILSTIIPLVILGGVLYAFSSLLNSIALFYIASYIVDPLLSGFALSLLLVFLYRSAIDIYFFG